MADTITVVDLAAGSEQVRPMTAGELAQRKADRAAAAAALAQEQEQALVELRCRCGRYLARTDWIMLPAAARPLDMSQTVADEIDANIDAWTAYRAALKAVFDDTVDPADPPALPTPPAAPTVHLD